MPTPQDSDDVLLGRRAVEMGLITPKQLSEALAEQRRIEKAGQEPPSLGFILVNRKLIAENKLASLLWEEEIGRSDAEIMDFLGSFDDAPAVSKDLVGPAPTRRLPIVKLEDPKGTPFGKYLLIKEVGRGGMAVVYEARESTGQKRIALKMLLPSNRIDPEEAQLDEERFIREARLSAKLPPHPNVVGTRETGVVDGRRYIAMDFIDGREMAQWWRKSYASTRMQVRVLRDVALGVHHAHQHGIIHRDLKPANILIDSRNQPHVTDFGLARGLRRSGEESLTLDNRVVGTPAYMSPEQAEGKKTLDKRSDVYTLGVMLYEILVGRTPFKGSTAVEIMVKVARDPLPPPSSVQRKGGLRTPPDRDLEVICLRALERSLKDRTPTAKAFADELSGWLRERGGKGGGMAAYRAFAWTGIGAGVVALLLILLAALGAFTSAPPAVSPAPKAAINPPTPGASTPPPPAPTTRKSQVIEGEGLKDAVASHGKTSVQNLSGASGNNQLFWSGGRPGSTLKFGIDFPEAGSATLLLRLTKAQDYAIVRLSLNGERISVDLDLYNPGIGSTGDLRFRGQRLKQGRNELEIRIVGTNPKATPATPDSDLFQVGLDRLEIQAP